LLPQKILRKKCNAAGRCHYIQFTAYFLYFGYDEFSANAFKVTKDAELDLDNDIRTNFAEKIEKGLKTEEKENLPVLFLIKIWTKHFWNF
jgi:polyphosphate kinase